MNKEFKRERRYVVLKGTDLNVLTEQEQKRLFTIAEMVANGRNAMGKPPLDCFVLEHDWPEFDIVVDMVRRRMEGEPTREAAHLHAIDTLTEKVTVLEKSLAVMDRQHMDIRELFDLKEGEETIPAITAFLDIANAEILSLRDYQTKAGAIIANLKEKLHTANDIAEDVFKLAVNAPEFIHEDVGYHTEACAVDIAMHNIQETLKTYLIGETCETCGGSGSVGGVSGQTPDSYSEETHPCPACTHWGDGAVTINARQPGMQTMRDLAMLVKQLCRAVTATDPAYSKAPITPDRQKAHTSLAMRAMDYLKRKGLQGSPLRVVAHGDHADSAWQERCEEFDAHLKPEGLRDGEPCGHPGCASHISHPCEGCGRIGARAQDSAPWATAWEARVSRYALVAKADGACTREAADGEYVKWDDHLSKLQELLKAHGDAALQEIDRLLVENGDMKAKLDYVAAMGLELGIMKTSDRPEGYLAHKWAEGSDHERMFREWADSIGAMGYRDLFNIVKQVVDALPSNRDWLDPDIEKVMRKVVSEGCDAPDITKVVDALKAAFAVAKAAPELNRSDINPDDACALDSAMIEVFQILKQVVDEPCGTCGGIGEIGGWAGGVDGGYQTDLCPDCHPEKATWSKKRPDAAGRWWYWTGDAESAPVLVKVVNAHRKREDGEAYLIAIDVPEQLPQEYVGNIEHGYWHPEIIPETPRV